MRKHASELGADVFFVTLDLIMHYAQVMVDFMCEFGWAKVPR